MYLELESLQVPGTPSILWDWIKTGHEMKALFCLRLFIHRNFLFINPKRELAFV